MLGKIRNLDPTNAVAHGLTLRCDIVVGTVAFKCRILPCVCWIICEPKRVFQSERLPHARALRHQSIIKRSGLLHTPLWQRFVWEGHHKATLIVFRGFHRTPIRCRPIAKTGNIHRPNIDGWFPINHPFRHTQANATPLTKSCHHADCTPIIGHTGHWSDHWVPIRAKCKWAVDRVLNPRLSKGGNTFKSQFQTICDIVQIRLQQFMPKIPRGAAHLPWRAHGFIGAQQHSFTFLAEINIRLIINTARQARSKICHFINFFSQQIVMFHWLNGNVQAAHFANLTRP